MSEAPSTEKAAKIAGKSGYADKDIHAGFITKQTPLSMRGGEASAAEEHHEQEALRGAPPEKQQGLKGRSPEKQEGEVHDPEYDI